MGAGQPNAVRVRQELRLTPGQELSWQLTVGHVPTGTSAAPPDAGIVPRLSPSEIVKPPSGRGATGPVAGTTEGAVRVWLGGGDVSAGRGLVVLVPPAIMFARTVPPEPVT